MLCRIAAGIEPANCLSFEVLIFKSQISHHRYHAGEDTSIHGVTLATPMYQAISLLHRSLQGVNGFLPLPQHQY